MDKYSCKRDAPSSLGNGTLHALICYISVMHDFSVETIRVLPCLRLWTCTVAVRKWVAKDSVIFLFFFGGGRGLYDCEKYLRRSCGRRPAAFCGISFPTENALISDKLFANYVSNQRDVHSPVF